jgi:hypothetical protein
MSVTLNELSNGATPVATPSGMPEKPRLDTTNVQPLNINEAVIPNKEEIVVGVSTGIPMLDTALQSLDGSIAEHEKQSAAIVEEGRRQRIEQGLADDNADPDAIEQNVSNTIHVQSFDDSDFQQPVKKEETVEKKVETVKTSAAVAGTKTETISVVADQSVYDEDEHLFDVDDEDMKLLDEDEDTANKNTEDTSAEDTEKVEGIKQTIRSEINKNFSPIKKKYDLSRFTISKKPINAPKVIADINSKAIECADGVLYALKRAVRMSAWKPMEIQSIDPSKLREGTVNYNNYIKNKLKLIYDHIIDENKPKSFEAWAMITPNTVVDDYMFTAYKATFGTANILTFNCNDDNCNNVFMENVPIHSMIKFKDDATKEEYMRILHEGNTDSTNDKYEVELFQVSDEYVVGLKVPSLYNTFIEPTLVDSNFSKKYEDLLFLLSYIDSIYKIDEENGTLIPIDTAPVETNKALTYKRRVKTFATIIKSLTSDQIQALNVETDKYDAGVLDDDGNMIKPITYVYPERKCTKCGAKIDEIEASPDNMLFSRHQLGLMKKI